MIRTGKVVSSSKGMLKVCFERPEMCAKCGQCGEIKETLIEIPGTASPGDWVDVDLPEGQLLKFSALVYVIPLLFLLLGLWLGSVLFGTETAQFICALVMTALSMTAVALYDRHLKKKGTGLPIIVAVRSPAARED